MAQIPLELQWSRHLSFASFVVGPNRAAVEHIRAIALGQRNESVWLAGRTGAGKTHLLTAACRAADEAGSRAMYLAVEPGADPGILAELEGIELLAIDDVGRVAGRPEWETALFSVLNSRLQRGRLLMAAEQAPRDCGFELADLVSRAGAAALYRLGTPDEGDLLVAIQLRASERGLELDETAARFLLTHVNRDAGALVDWLERADRYALAMQRKITVPLLRQMLESEDDGSA
jgi:DnaA family protein